MRKHADTCTSMTHVLCSSCVAAAALLQARSMRKHEDTCTSMRRSQGSALALARAGVLYMWWYEARSMRIHNILV